MAMKDNLIRLRKAAGLSQQQLAQEAKVSQQLISRLERGIDLTTKKLPEIARALKTSVYDIDENYAPAEDGTDEELVRLLLQADDDVKQSVLLLLRRRT